MRIPEEVLVALKNVKVDEHQVVMLPMDRKLYEKVNRVLELLGGKWNRKAKAHVFDEDPGDLINDAVATGEITDPKKEYQYFSTPAALAQRMAGLVGGGGNDIFLEPSFGSGSLLQAIRKEHQLSTIVAIELNPEMFKQACVDFAPDPATILMQGDFLRFENSHPFHRIVMNPPFRNGQDIAHIKHAYSMLAPGGRLVSVTAPGWTFRTDNRHAEFRDWALMMATKDGLIDLPEGTFKESGTNIRTMLLVIDKPN